MGDNQGGAALHQILQRLTQLALTYRVQVGSRLIQDQDRRILQQRAGDGNALPLPTGKLHAPLTHNRVVSVWKNRDEVMAVGLPCGLFHFSLFRIAPTAVLGIVITGVALLTGSIFPGIVLHMGNNAFAIWSGDAGFPLDDLGTPIYVGAAVTMAVLLWIVYRNRTPYPAE